MTTELSKLIAEIDALAEKATRGPLVVQKNKLEYSRDLIAERAEGVRDYVAYHMPIPDAEFHAALVNSWRGTLRAALTGAQQQGEWVTVPKAAIDWLMGEGESFEPPQGEHLPRRQGGTGRYWWRSEFRKRAGLDTAPAPNSPAEQMRDAAANKVPTNWLDPLLTGPEAVLPSDGPYTNRHIEALLRGIQDRIRALPSNQREG